MIGYDILSTGSKGNAVVINNFIMIDCGVSFKKIKGFIESVKLMLLTHEHGDHVKKSTAARLARERPSLRWAAPPHLIALLIECGVHQHCIDVIDTGKIYSYGAFKVESFSLVHNVENVGWKIYFSNGEKMIYATDTSSMEGISAKEFDLYMLEANFEEHEIMERIKEKEENGGYPYELGVLHNHLSKEKADLWLLENMGENSEYVYLHEHED